MDNWVSVPLYQIENLLKRVLKRFKAIFCFLCEFAYRSVKTLKIAY